MFWQCSNEDYMKSCFKAVLLIITHKVGGIGNNSQRKISGLKLIKTCVSQVLTNFLNRSESRCDDSVVAVLWLLDHF